MRHSGTLAASNIAKAHGAHPVLRDVSLTVRPGSRIGVVGPNGIGKTTLLRVLAGVEAEDAGPVTRSPESLAVGYLPQEPDLGRNEPLLAYFSRRTGIAAAEAEMDELAARLGPDPSVAGPYSDALERFLELGGADLPARAASTCAEIGLRASLDVPAGSLSGGETARAALASILLSRFDVFCLDEPSNNLDMDGLERLERFLAGVEAGVVVVSHDRAFLDRTVNCILEFEAETGRTREYAGGWSEYESERIRERSREQAAFARYAEKRGRFETLLHVRRDQARPGGAMADRRGTQALRSKVRQAKRRLQRLERVDKPWLPWRLELSILPHRRSGESVVGLAGAVVEHVGFRLGPVDLDVGFGDRLLVLGTNGSGKTTLLHALLGTAALAEGRRYLGSGVAIGTLDQPREEFTVDAPLITRFASGAGIVTGEARTLLAKFGLGADDVNRRASSLSPGERTRASLAAFAARGVNCLVLDEPTNHLDLEAIEELEGALEEFEATVVLVTHDRRFLERFRATHAVELVLDTDSTRSVRQARVIPHYDRIGG